jgi:hypothetical protein
MQPVHGAKQLPRGISGNLVANIYESLERLGKKARRVISARKLACNQIRPD